MFALEPGPIEIGDFPLGPRIVQEAHFERLAADYVDARQNGDVVLSGLQTHLTAGDPPELDAAYQRTIAGAEDATASELVAGAGSQAAPLIDAGNGVSGSLG